MKKSLQQLLSVCFLFSALAGYAQSPQQFNYQGIARDAKGNPMSRQTMSLKLSVLPAPEASMAEYEEVQTVTTNEFGLYTLHIGAGTALNGQMKSVTWETGNKYLRVAIDPQGGTNYQDAGTTQLLSVPYALYADRAGSAKSGSERTGAVSSNAAHVAGDANYLSKFTALNTIGKSRLFDNGTSIGLGTTTPVSTAAMHIRRTTNGQYLYMENPDTIGNGSFRLYNDVPTNFATFTKYGSKVTGGYTGISDKYPFANILGYGNNGPFLNAGTGNIGFAITKAGTNKLKIHIDAATERISFGGNATPQTPVHFNNTASGNDTVKFTNQTTGHLAADGTELRFNGNTTRLMNRENGALILGTNNTDRIAIGGSGNVGIGTTSPGALLDVNGQVKIQGGNPGPGKILTSDSNGLASWKAPERSYINQWNGTVGPGGWELIYKSDSNWVGGKGILVTGNCTFIIPSYHLNNPQFGGFQHDIVLEIRVAYAPYGIIDLGRVRYQMPGSAYNFSFPLKFSLPVNGLLPSTAGVPFSIYVNNDSKYFNTGMSSWNDADIEFDVEVSAIEY